MMQRVARRLGYVPQPQFESVTAKLKEARERLERSGRSLERAKQAAEQSRLDAEQLKRRCVDAEKAAMAAREETKRMVAKLAKLEGDHARHIAKLREGLTAQAAKRIASLETKVAATARTAAAGASEWQAMEQRVAATAQDLDGVRDSLMAVEVKLEIVEGAANVLDRRLRARSASTSTG